MPFLQQQETLMDSHSPIETFEDKFHGNDIFGAPSEQTIIPVPDISIVSWRDILKIMSMGSPVLIIGCNECRQINHFKQMEEIFANSCYEGAFGFFDNKEQLSFINYQSSDKKYALDENILEQIVISDTGRISFPGTAYVDIGKK